MTAQHRLTIKEIAKRTGLSEYAVRANVVTLFEVLPVEERVRVMEYMLRCRQHRRGVAR